jgi:hypothetical protein
MLDALVETRTPHGYAINHGLHVSILMEPQIAEGYGVRTAPLGIMSHAMTAPSDRGRGDEQV